jgi:hypothetical protein
VIDCKLANVVTRNSDFSGFSDGEKRRAMNNNDNLDDLGDRIGPPKRSNEWEAAIGQTFT